jgi:ribonuclease P protein component
VASSLKELQLRSSKDFQKVGRQGKRKTLKPWLSAKILNSPNSFKIGWAVPRSTGSAVTRNKIKRWVRECIRKRDFNHIKKVEVVLYFKPAAQDKNLKELNRSDIQQGMDELFNQINR